MTRYGRMLLVPVALLAAACADDRLPSEPRVEAPLLGRGGAAAPQTAASPHIVDVLLEANARTGEFSTLIAAVVAADLVGPLSSQGERTVFAPTDAAFAAYGVSAANVGAVPRAELVKLLTFHVAPDRLDAATVVSASRIRMANGEDVEVRVEGGSVFLENARVIATDIPASNGIVHVLDAVLLKPAPAPNLVDVLLEANAQTGEFSTLIAAVVAADLVEVFASQVSEVTVFAPTDAAFARLELNSGNVGALPREQLRNILLYHVAYGRRDAASVLASSRIPMLNGGTTRIRLRGGEPRINAARIIATDVGASNGIAHVIDTVLLP